MKRRTSFIGIVFILLCSSCAKKMSVSNPASSAANTTAAARTLDTYYESHDKWPENNASQQEQVEFASSFYSFSLDSYGPDVSLLAPFSESFFERNISPVQPTEYFPKGGFKLYLNFEKGKGKLDSLQLSYFSLATEPPKHYTNLSIYKACLRGSNCQSDQMCEMFTTAEKCGPDFEFDGFSIDYSARDQYNGIKYQLHLSEKEFWVIAENKDFFNRIVAAHSGPTLIITGWGLGPGKWESEDNNIREITFRNLRNSHTGKKHGDKTTVQLNRNIKE